MRPVPTEGPGWGELSQLVPDHILGNVNWDELLAIMDRQRVPDKLGNDNGPPRPGLDDLLLPALIHRFDLLEKLGIHIRTLFQRPRHTNLRSDVRSAGCKVRSSPLGLYFALRTSDLALHTSHLLSAFHNKAIRGLPLLPGFPLDLPPGTTGMATA